MLFAQISSETTLGEYIDFDVEAITSDTAVDPTHVKESREEKQCRGLAIRKYYFNQ